MNNLIDKPEECLNYINSCLKPKKEEKKKHGEVFTPMDTVNKLLINLMKNILKNIINLYLKKKILNGMTLLMVWVIFLWNILSFNDWTKRYYC